jgi:hypothetical protein
MADLNRLRERGARAFPNGNMDSILSRVRAIVGSEKDMPPDEQGRLAAAALSKLQGSQAGDPTPIELAALELMLRMTRPAPLVHNGVPDEFKKPDHSKIFPEWTEFRKLMQPFSQTIGRIDTAGPSLSASDTVGTGFLVGRGLLMTNRHVLNDISHQTGLLQTGQAVIRFQIEDSSFAADQPKQITGVAAVHDSLDAVLLTVEDSEVQSYAPIDAPRKDDTDIVVAGYPSEVSDRNPLFLRSTFGTSLGVLRAAPGQITALVPNGFTHDCSTLGGNSGSPVFSMSRGEIIGLHSGGSFLWNNQAVDGESLAAFVKEKANGGK